MLNVETGVVQTLTSLCPITETTTISGKEETVTYTSTSLYTTILPTYVEVTATAPDTTKTAVTGVVSTITSLCPVTETKTVSGSLVTVIYTTTSFIVTNIGTTVQVATTLPAKTTTVATGVLQTITSLCPVTEVETISGIEYTVTKTSTSLIVTEVYTTDYSKTTLPGGTKTIETYVYQTSTSLCPVTEVQTISGVPITKVYTSTIVTEVQVPTTIVQYTTTQATEYKTTDVYETTTCIESVYTTISAGSTIVLTATQTNTIQVTAVQTLTSTVPAAIGETTVYIPTTIGHTIETVAIVTVPSIVRTVTLGTTYYANTTHVQTSTYIQPSTLTVGGQTTSYVVQPSVSVSSVAATSVATVAPSAPIEANNAGMNAPGLVMGFVMGVLALL
ncbi:putative repetitive proline-rich cell wall protein [Botrytis cinerea BcDW1]|uniref:Putative repetitive proline-rich cell wall protein n=1 Tax=Botryotinia fuckeliana (strain BcDW1) TaxID=1290391 RepID=M7ULU9_BOTF1|nr:putative repetitive proline-rich cell wall protein [Botrytis cinerea BcDW1]